MPGYPTIGPSKLTDTAAVRLFERYLPPSWLPRYQVPDFFVDCVVETEHQGEPTGFEFSAQIKGTKGNAMRRKMKIKHLRYYLQQSRKPVFIFLADTRAQKVYWVFVQEYVHSHLSETQLSTQGEATVRFDKNNDLADIQRFRNALVHAETYVRNLWPGELSAAAEYRRRELSILDRRIDVHVSGDHEHETIILRAREPIAIKAKFSADSIELGQAVRNLQEHGRAAKLRVQNFSMSGSAILETLCPSVTGVLQLSAPTCSGIVMIRCGELHVQIDGRWNGGTHSSTFSGALENSPLNITTHFDKAALSRNEVPKLTASLRLVEWFGQPLVFLRGFDAIFGLYSALLEGKSLALEMFVGEECVCKCSIVGINDANARDDFLVLAWIRKCRAVASHLGVNPRLPIPWELSDEDAHGPLRLYDLISRGERKDRLERQTLEITGNDIVSAAQRSETEQQEEGTCRLRGEAYPIVFLGIAVHLYDFVMLYTHVKLNKQVKTGANTTFVIHMTEHSEQIMEWKSGKFSVGNAQKCG